jgi:hypothetical protein
MTYIQEMKLRFFIFALLFGVVSCQKETSDSLNSNVLEGSWLLIEALRAGEDGNRVFLPVDSEREIKIAPDNTFITNYDVCQAIEEGEKFSGSFDRIGIQEFLIPCAGSLLNSVQGRLENGYLVLYYPCTVPCAYKFEKIADFTE